MARSKQQISNIYTKAFELGSGSDADNIRTVTGGLTDAGFVCVRTTGPVTVTPAGSSVDVVIQVVAGQVFPLLVRHVKNTGSTPTDMFLVWS